MNIHCRVIRKNGTYKTVHVDARRKEFTLDKQIYYVRGYNYGKVFCLIPRLTATYLEGYPLPLYTGLIEKDKKFKFDTKAIKNLTNKKILNVFGESELTKLEMILVLISAAGIGVGMVNLILLLQLFDKLGI